MKFKNMIAIAAATTCLAAPAVSEQTQVILAAQPQAEDDAEMRIRTSVRIKMRSQSISAAVCNVQMGMDPATLTTPLDTQISEFEQFVSALLNGDPSLGVTLPEERKMTHAAAQKVTDAWMPVKDAALNFAAGNGQAADTDVVLTENLNILEYGHDFTAELVQQYANPAEATFADLLTIVIATRQGMLIQKAAKEACLVGYSGKSADKVATTMDVYENTLYALRNGMPAAGIVAAPTAEIKEGLDVAFAQWTEVKPALMQMKDGNLDGQGRAQVLKKIDRLMETMLDVSILYVDFTKTKQQA